MELDNKPEIVKAILPVLQMTRNLYDLVDLEYKKVSSDFEIVEATFANGFKKTVNVSHDSGTAMITDIVRQLV